MRSLDELERLPELFAAIPRLPLCISLTPMIYRPNPRAPLSLLGAFDSAYGMEAATCDAEDDLLRQLADTQASLEVLLERGG